MRKWWTTEQDAVLCRMWADEIPAEQIAAALDRSYSGVLNRAEQIGLPRRYGGIKNEIRIHAYGVQRESPKQAAMWVRLLAAARS